MDGLLTQIAAVTNSSGMIEVYGVTGAGTLFHRRQAARNAADPSVAGNWTGWDQLQTPGAFGSYRLRSIAVTIDLGGRLNIFATAMGNQLFWRKKLGDGTVYTDWTQVPGSMYSVAATKQGGGAGGLELLGLDAHGKVFRNTSSGIFGEGFRGWAPLGGVMRPFTGGLDAAPVLTKVVAGGGKMTLTWTDLSTNEDAFYVMRLKPDGFHAGLADLPSADIAGVGASRSWVDSPPGPGPHASQSNVVCAG